MNLLKGTTTDDELLKLAKIISVRIDGVLDSSEIKKPIPKKGTYLILLRPKEIDVGHWTCIHNGYYYDSMGENGLKKFKTKKYNEKQYQGSYDEFCGIWCLLFIYCRQKNRMDLLDHFHDLNLYVLS